MSSTELKRLRWSAPVEDVAKALIADQSVSFSIERRRTVRVRRVEFLFVPLGFVQDLRAADHHADGLWHVWQSGNHRGTSSRLPAAGSDLAARFELQGDDASLVCSALDLLMSTLLRQAWCN